MNMAAVPNEVIFKDNKSFCSCPRACDKEINCDCGNVVHTPVWGWDETHCTPAAETSNNNQQVYFHKGYSTGNACIRGNLAMVAENDYYWEIKVLTSVYGTSIMIGVGTEAFDMNQSNDEYCNLLGCDNESWGMKFNGKLFHSGVVKDNYNAIAGFTIGSIIGVHLNMWNGTLEYFLNRIPLGIAFVGLKDKILYPLISSTAAHSSMKLLYTHAEPFSLNLLSLKAMPVLNDLPPGLKKHSEDCWWLFPKSTRLKEDDTEKCGANCNPPHEIFIMVASDEEDEENDSTSIGSDLLAQRMRVVLENSNRHHHFLNLNRSNSSNVQSYGNRDIRPIRRCRYRYRTHWTDY